jgi:NTE family protein
MAQLPPKAYAILAGGGVKGAALAGCLYHAHRLGIEFVGYGGSSAGALVATLAAIGCTPDELQTTLVNTPFVDIVAPEDRGARLRTLSGLFPKKWTKTAMAGVVSRGVANLPLLSDITRDCGLLDGAGLTAFLQSEFRKKGIPENVRFSEIGAHIKPKLKVMCTDLTLRKAVEFGSGALAGRNPNVITAVRASCGYPVVFRPQPDPVSYSIPGETARPRIITHQLVDGGLASNLPISLFFQESAESDIPIIAFDLVQEVAPHEGEYTMRRLVVDLFATALGSGDTMAQRLMPRVTHVPVIIPSNIDTFDIHLGTEEAQELFKTGVRDAEKTLGTAPPTVSETLAEMVAQFAARWPKATVLRAALMVPDNAGHLVVKHSHNMKGAADLAIRVPFGAGVSGVTWVVNAARAADPHEASIDGLPPEQRALVPKDRRAMISFPVRAGGTSGAPIAVLSLDSATPLKDSGWLDDLGAISDLGAKWASQLAQLIK